ncbi:MAG: intermembrane phospholipid transport protein YdbH family protein, partial [Kofleriaceae bacterium]
SLDELAIGGLVMRDLEARVRGGAGELRACVTGRASHATGEACSSLPGSAAELAALTAADVTWSVREADARVPWTGQGRGRLVWSSGPRLHDGRIEIAVPVRTIGIATVEEARLVADVEGDPDRLELRGEARAARAAIRDDHATIHVRDVVLPFEVHGRYAGGALQLATDHPIVVRAEDVRMAGEPLRVTRPEVVLREGGEPPFVVGGRNAWPDRLRWRAAEVRGGTSQLRTLTGTIATRGGKLGVARWSAATAQWRTAHALRPTGTFDLSRGRRGVVTWRAPAAEWRRAQISEPSGRLDLGTMRGRVAWAAVRGPYALAIGRGEVTYRSGREQVRIESGRADALGGSLLVEPFDARLDAGSSMVVHARRLQLAQVARAVGRGRLEGSGLVDGSFAVQFDQVDVAVTAAAFEARPRARLRVRDAAWRKRAAAAARASANKAALHTRIVGALSELDCARLAAVLGPAGADPDLTLSIRGRGVRVPQELDLSIRVRGVRAAARTLHRY